MRIRYLKIKSWRHFRNIELNINEDAGLICIVGANGTGKSHILELIAACAHRLGLSPGIDPPRGDPFRDAHEFEVELHLEKGVSQALEERIKGFREYFNWDRTLRMESRNDVAAQTCITAGGIADTQLSQAFAAQIVQQLVQSKDVHFLSLDADRAYPQRNVSVNDLAQAYEIDWSVNEYTRGRSYRRSKTLYDEWIKYSLSQENRTGTELLKQARRAKKLREPAPELNDPFEEYAESLKHVLPHIFFTGVDHKARTLSFDTTGVPLTFDQLSGGEREIAFLLGQIDRFRLRHGLFLLDEPELHLNADLIRAWVGYLTSTVATGQIWLATHSLEAVEAAGQNATFVLERDEQAREVKSIARLDSRPVLSALSRAVGTPAFSISQLLFVFVEGEESVGERERFFNLAGRPKHVRFITCGSCKEVQQRSAALRNLGEEEDTGIRLGGIIDRDFLREDQIQVFETTFKLHVLRVHEVENFFLHPKTLGSLMTQNGYKGKGSWDLIRQFSDARAGSWIFQYAMATKHAENLPEIPSSTKQTLKGLNWPDLEQAPEAAFHDILEKSAISDDDKKKLQSLLMIGFSSYVKKRDSQGLWKFCEGKQILNSVASAIGFRDSRAFISATFSLWSVNSSLLPKEVSAFREYLDHF